MGSKFTDVREHMSESSHACDFVFFVCKKVDSIRGGLQYLLQAYSSHATLLNLRSRCRLGLLGSFSINDGNGNDNAVN